MRSVSWIAALLVAGCSSQTASAPSDAGMDASDAAGPNVVGFAEIQLDLENEGGARGAYPSCTNGTTCHQNEMVSRVHVIPNPTSQELHDNWVRIVTAGEDGGIPWVTPRDETARMLTEVPVSPEVHSRWLAWIQAGAPFDPP